MADIADTDNNLIRTLLNLPPGQTTFTKTQLAYATVREAIVTHSLPANTPLDEAKLLAEFPVGRTPLREALKRLMHEGFLRWPAHQAPIILDVGVHEMRYLYETRRMLEPTIARLAAVRLTPLDRILLESTRLAMVKACASGYIYSSVEHDFALHAAISGATHNRFLAEASYHLNLQSLRLWYRAQERHGIANIHVSHTELVHAITTGQADLAEQLARDHIEMSLQRQQAMLDEHYVTYDK
ncbi:MAG: GntR family transcriptional regulator [Thermomicrobiales bacterium]|nr:GntR family transcriptional regulator [Thermomicrobiales bacterium]